MKEYLYKPYIKETKYHMCYFVEEIVFGRLGKILKCRCGKTKTITFLNKDYELKDNI